MNQRIQNVINGQEENYIFPFFWQHGEDEATLRHYMQVIDKANMKAVCVESRPHPDFCGPKWWADMDVILDEARKRGMRVWILDDSHFPTGLANNALEDQPDSLCRQSVVKKKMECRGGEVLKLDGDMLHKAAPIAPSEIEAMMEQYMGIDPVRAFDDDVLLGVVARQRDGEETQILTADREDSGVRWEAPEGIWDVYILQLTRNAGYHRNYINMMDRESCRLLIDHVYEPHWEKYQADFGTTIAGFFSDEPELGNGHLYDPHTLLGVAEDLPWSRELENVLQEKWQENFLTNLTYLWENEGVETDRRRVRYDYMDAVTRLVEQDFSMQIGEWCEAHGVEYIGHLIEDNNQHARTGSSLGHYFRGLSGQHMAGIDDIGGQVFPQGEDISYDQGPMACRDGEFYHFMLGKLADSAAALDPRKKGRAMCEIFGNYGWSEGVHLEKYLVDHFLVRGVNRFVPHAFSPKEFPDPDCPPHFYAQGNNPQYRHFGALMKYTNRMCELLNGGRHEAPVAVIYHAEGEWSGRTVFSQKAGRVLTEAQIDFDYVPMDVFAERTRYGTRTEQGKLIVNTQKYQAVLVPEMEFMPRYFTDAVEEMKRKGITVEMFSESPQDCVKILKEKKIPRVSFDPADSFLRYREYVQEDGTTFLMIVNEGTETYRGRLAHHLSGSCYELDAWNNTLSPVEKEGEEIVLPVRPLQSTMLVFDPTGRTDGDETATADTLSDPLSRQYRYHPEYFTEQELSGDWERSLCRSIEYPGFGKSRQVHLPDHLWEEKPEFSGFVRYEKQVEIQEPEGVVLIVTDAEEGVEVFVNGDSLGIQCVPPFVYVPGDKLRKGINTIRIEVATTLERELACLPDAFGQVKPAEGKTGLTGKAVLLRKTM